MEEPHLPLVTSSMQRISNLILEAEPVLLAAVPAGAAEPLLHPEPVDDHPGTPLG